MALKLRFYTDTAFSKTLITATTSPTAVSRLILLWRKWENPKASLSAAIIGGSIRESRI